MVVGFLGVPFFKFIVPKIVTIGPYFEQIDVLGPSFLLSIIGGYVVSKIWPDPSLQIALTISDS